MNFVVIMVLMDMTILSQMMKLLAYSEFKQVSPSVKEDLFLSRSARNRALTPYIKAYFVYHHNVRSSWIPHTLFETVQGCYNSST